MASKRELKAEITREKILEAAAEEIYRVGFRAASLSEILNKLGISKGAVYHHFPDKMSLGYAVLEECYGKTLEETWETALREDDPLTGIAKLLTKKVNMKCQDTLCCGCPINNLATEMSPVDEGFRERIEAVYKKWHKQIARAILDGQSKGLVRGDIEPSEVAYFVIASIQGAVGLAKNAQDYGLFKNAVQGLFGYLDGLRVQAA
ncbi:MAG: TetR/AcrR family transcriptional regulator [Gammaproteobacteria bacterium]